MEDREDRVKTSSIPFSLGGVALFHTTVSGPSDIVTLMTFMRATSGT